MTNSFNFGSYGSMPDESFGWSAENFFGSGARTEMKRQSCVYQYTQVTVMRGDSHILILGTRSVQELRMRIRTDNTACIFSDTHMQH